MISLTVLGSNQTLLRLTPDNGGPLLEILFSYSTPVAAWSSRQGYMRTDVHHSRTTQKHITTWLRSHNALAETVPQSTIHALLHGDM